MTRLIHCSCFVMLVFMGLPLSAQDLILDDFTMSGDTYIVGDECYRLTDEYNYSSGSIWYKYPVSLSNPFDIELKIMMGCKDEEGADGMVFIFTSRPNRVGGAGEGIGFGGLRPSFGIEIDTWENEHLGDPPQDHIAILQDGSPAHWYNLAGPVKIPNVEDCRPHRIFVSWKPDYKVLSVAVDGVERIRYKGDIINEVFGGVAEVYWGVSAATGRYNNRQEICFEKLEFAKVAPLAYLMPSQISQLKKESGLLLDRVKFPSGQVRLNEATTFELDKLVRYLKRNDGYAIEVAAFTDSSGSESGNRRISQARAEAIKQYFISKGIPSKRIYAFGYGESNPIATNGTAEGRAQNRRVAFSIFRIVP